MTFDLYRKKYISEAKKVKLSKEKIDDNLRYAESLFKKGMPIIYDQEHLSLLVGYESYFVLGISNEPEKFYREFEITQRNGKKRIINEPMASLKEIQRWIKYYILDRIEISSYAKAYRVGYSIKDNARYHRKQDVIISVDIKNFFGNIKIKRVYNVFSDCGYTAEVAMLLAKLCCLDDCLPQGAPTSPVISNIVMRDVDHRLASIANKRNLRFTRYADDITFSGEIKEKDVDNVLKNITNVLDRKRLYLNDKKTKILKKHQRQMVTGIVVNEKMQVSRSKRKKIRTQMHYIEKFGLENHLKTTGENRSNYVKHLHGLIQYCLFINPKDKDMRGYLEVIKQYM